MQPSVVNGNCSRLGAPDSVYSSLVSNKLCVGPGRTFASVVGLGGISSSSDYIGTPAARLHESGARTLRCRLEPPAKPEFELVRRCRVESLAKDLGVPLLMTAELAAALGRDDVVSLGFHALKGVGEPREILTMRSLRAG